MVKELTISFRDNINCLGQISLKKVFSVHIRKSKDHHRIQYIRISLGTKFHLKQTIPILLAKFAQKLRKKKLLSATLVFQNVLFTMKFSY